MIARVFAPTSVALTPVAPTPVAFSTCAASPRLLAVSLVISLAMSLGLAVAGEQTWPQLQGDAFRSGDATQVSIADSLALAAAVPATDGLYAAPVVSPTQVFVIDGAGVVHAIDRKTHRVNWKFATAGGEANCNQVAAPALVGDKYLHVGTMSGFYYVLDQSDGGVIARIDCGEPIFSAPAVGKDRVYFATLGAHIHAVDPAGTKVWEWDFVREVVGFQGDRWSGADWTAFRGDRVTWKDHFVCSRDISLIGKTVVMPAGGRTVFVEDGGAAAVLRGVAEIPEFAGSEYPATFGQSADASGRVFVQWHRRDNAGRVETMKLGDAGVEYGWVEGTQTAIDLPGLLSFAPVAIRGDQIFRVRPESGLGLCRHAIATAKTETLCDSPAISPPIVAKEDVVYGDLSGNLIIVPLDGGETRRLATRPGTPISAPLAIADGEVYVPSEDGHLYVFSPTHVNAAANAAAKPAADDTAKPAANAAANPAADETASSKGGQPADLAIWKLRSPLSGPLADPKYDWYTNYGDAGGTNANDQGLRPPLRMRWARRLEGTIKHLPVCGGGRLYIHTAEGQVIAYEQDTGRQLWRRYWPDVYLSFTSPLYHDGKLLIPQAGIKRSVMRCLDAATGELLWETPFTGSPSWSRQFPPVVHDNIAIYASGAGEYAAQGTEKPFIFRGNPAPTQDGREVMSWIYSNDNPYYPKNHIPTVWGWDMKTGKVIWKKDFAQYGRGGNDCGLCLLDGKVFYSTFFGYSTSQRQRRGLPVEHNGLTACLDPKTGETIWLTTKHYVTAKCTLSGRDGRIYIGGYNRATEQTEDRFVWCLDAKDGSLVWRSDPVTSALNVVTVGSKFIFSNALRGKGNVFDRETGKVVATVGHNYACCRFTMSGSYVLGANMDMIDLAEGGKLVSTGPAIDSRECLGAVVSNGRIFYASQASGFLVSQSYGEASERLPAAWEVRP